MKGSAKKTMGITVILTLLLAHQTPRAKNWKEYTVCSNLPSMGAFVPYKQLPAISHL